MQQIPKILTPRSLALLIAVICLAAHAQAAEITGTVKGPDGAPFKGAFVQAQNTKTKITVNVLSHKDGGYRVEDLPAGEYVLRIRAVGYQAEPRTGVALTASQSASMDWAFALSGRKVDTQHPRQGNGFRAYIQLP
jgi:Carboxypeptidase regulatory-like domain